MIAHTDNPHADRAPAHAACLNTGLTHAMTTCPPSLAHTGSWSYRRFAMVLCVAMGVTAMACQDQSNGPVEGEAKLSWYYIHLGRIHPGSAEHVLKKGDEVQFRYQAGGRRNLVMVSIDGDGTFSTLHPRNGQTPVGVTPFGVHALPSNLILDTAPGPEVYVARFDAETVEEAVTELQTTWNDGGLMALKKLNAERDDIALRVLMRAD